MLGNRLSRFLRDERGSYTVWSLLWFMVYIGIGGAAVDATDAYRYQTLLQATADAAATAGAMSLPDAAKARQAAYLYSQHNMRPEHNGAVLDPSDIQVGTWNFASESFTPDTPVPNAVYVVTRRAEANDNPLGMNVLSFLGLVGLNAWWNINTEAVAVRGAGLCENNGLKAQNELWIRAVNYFYNKICLHGENSGIDITIGNDFDSDVAMSTGCVGCLDAPPPAWSDPDFQQAWANGGEGNSMLFEHVNALAQTLNTLKDMPNTNFADLPEAYQLGYAHMYQGGSTRPDYYEGSSLPSELQPHTVYDISCGGEQLNLPINEPIQNVMIFADCRIHASANANLQNVVIATTATPGQADPAAMHFAGQAQLGDGDCKFGGGVELYALGSIHFAAQAEIYGSRIVAGYDVDFTAGHTVGHGLAVEAGHDINLRSTNEFGLCTGLPNGPIVWVYSLVR